MNNDGLTGFQIAARRLRLAIMCACAVVLVAIVAYVRQI